LESWRCMVLEFSGFFPHLHAIQLYRVKRNV
jgi:hypothetical protein